MKLRKKVAFCLLEAEEYLDKRYESLPTSTRYYLLCQAGAQLAYSQKKRREERRKIARRAFVRALMGLYRTGNRKTKNKTYRFSPLLRRLAAADYFAWRRVTLLREGDLKREPFPQASWEDYWGRGRTIPEDILLERLGLDLESLAFQALAENVEKYRKRKNQNRFQQGRLFPSSKDPEKGEPK